MKVHRESIIHFINRTVNVEVSAVQDSTQELNDKSV